VAERELSVRDQAFELQRAIDDVLRDEELPLEVHRFILDVQNDTLDIIGGGFVRRRRPSAKRDTGLSRRKSRTQKSAAKRGGKAPSRPVGEGVPRAEGRGERGGQAETIEDLPLDEHAANRAKAATARLRRKADKIAARQEEFKKLAKTAPKYANPEFKCFSDLDKCLAHRRGVTSCRMLFLMCILKNMKSLAPMIKAAGKAGATAAGLGS
jgi:hypothetical protein